MESIDFTWLFIKMLASLVIVVGAAVLILKYLVPKIGARSQTGKNSYIQILSRFVLEPKRSLYLLKIGKKNLVVGCSESGLQKITELSEEELGSDISGD